VVGLQLDPTAVRLADADHRHGMRGHGVHDDLGCFDHVRVHDFSHRDHASHRSTAVAAKRRFFCRRVRSLLHGADSGRRAVTADRVLARSGRGLPLNA
jgi:hypothetical protein